MRFKNYGCEWIRASINSLSKIVTKQTGFDYTSTIKSSLCIQEMNNTLPYIQTKNFKEKEINYKTDYYIPENIAALFPKINLNEKCVLLSLVGASVGNVGLFDNKKHSFLSGAIAVIKCFNENDINNIYYYLLSKYGQTQIKKSTKGAAQATITIEDIRNYNISFSKSKEEQLKIINFFYKIDDRINSQKKIIESKKSLIKSISQHYFKNKISNIELKDVVLINKGKQINGSLLNDTFNYLFFNGGSDASGKYNDYNAENCISISEGGNSCGYVNFIREKFWSGGHNYTLIPTKKINLDYLYFFLKYKEKEIMSLRVGTGLPNIQKESLYKFKIYAPDYNIQSRIAIILMKFSESIKNEEKILKLYQKQKDYLLNKMFI